MIQKLAFFIKFEGEEYLLKYAPEEWDETSIRWKRSTKYFGISRDFSLPLKFVEDGAKLLRNIFYTGNIEEQASLIIYVHVNLSVGYSKIYEGEFDFSTFIDQDDYVEINIADNNIESDIKANESTEYDIEIDEAEHTVSMPEVPKIDKAVGNVSSSGLLTRYFVPAFIFTDTEEIDDELFEINSTFDTYGEWSAIIDPNESAHFLTAFSQVNIHVYLDINITGVVETTYLDPAIFLTVYTSDMDAEQDDPLKYIPIYRNGRITFSFNIELEEGKKYYLVFKSVPLFARMPNILGEISTIEISYSNPTEELKFKAYRADEVFNILIEKMTGINPEYENEALGQIKISSGDGVRNIEHSKIKTTFNDFFKSIHSVTGYCMGLENGLPILAPYEYFFNDVLNIIDVGEVTDIEIKPATDFLYSNIKNGYTNQSYEEELGRDEYNTEQQYSTGFNRISNALDLVSKYRADHLGIRKIRIELDKANLNDEDRQADNDIFMVFTEIEPYQDNIYRAITAEDFEEVDGIDGRKEAINLPITPKRNLLNHSRFLASSLYRTNAILFESSKKDVDLRTVDQNGEVVERRNIYISELPDPLFLPYLIKFNSPIGINAIQNINNKENGYISFEYKSKKYRGFIMETSANISRTDIVEITVLPIPNTNIETLIR